MTLRVEHGAHAAIGETGHEGVADAQGAARDEHRGHGATAAVELGLEDVAGCEGVGIGLQLEDVGLEENGLEQVVDADLLLCGDVDEHVLSAPLLWDDAVLGELLAHLVRVGTRLVDLVHGHDDGHAGGVRVVDGLDRLRHDAVIGRHD